MRTQAIFTCFLLLFFASGCTNETDSKKMEPKNKDNTWTSDTLLLGDTEAIREKVRSDPGYLHERDYVGDTPLLTGINDPDLVKFLLDHGADPNVEVDDGYTCLLTAIESEEDESIAIVATLISAGADIHKTGINGWTPLHMAAARGHVEKARLLIEAGADVNRRTEIDASETPLMEAASSGQPGTVQLLLDHGADPSMRDTIHNLTPLESARQASEGPDPEVVEFLKKENFQVDFDDVLSDMDLTEDEMKLLKETVKDIDMTQSYIDSSNRIVSEGNHAEVIRILTEHRR